MKAIQDLSRRIVGWKSGDVLHNVNGEVCAFVRGTEVFTFRQRHIGVYEQGLFRNAQGEVVGTVSDVPKMLTHRRRRYRITRWFYVSVPAPRPTITFRAWAIWDRDLVHLSRGASSMHPYQD